MSAPTPIVIETRRLLPSHRRLGRLSLRVVSGPDRGKKFCLDLNRNRPIRGGRGPHNDLILTDDSVSNEHFELRPEAATVMLRDLGSTNGVVLGSARVREAWIGPGSRFVVGDSELELVSVDPVEVSLWPDDQFEGMLGRSAVMRELFNQLDQIARQEGVLRCVPVLLGGQTGTGKELAARALHNRSSRRDKPFIAVDFTTLATGSAEAGGLDDRDGLFRSASGGTLFIDEVGELAPELQIRLLRPLEQRRLLELDVRVIATTHHSLIKLIEQNRFRDDLYYRLQGVYLELPSLRERGDDVLLLAQHFLDDLAASGAADLRLSDEARGLLRSDLWPGNVRQLQRVIQRAAIVADGPQIRRKHLALEVNHLLGVNLEFEQFFNMQVREAGDEFERKYYRRLLCRFPTRTEAARFAGVTPEGLRVALRRLGIDSDAKPRGERS